jgi:HK97 family phage portal protein
LNRLQQTFRYLLAKAAGFPPVNSSDPALGRYMGVMSTASGATVTPTGSLALAGVYGCVRVRANTIGSLPFQLYKEGKNGREKATGHFLYPLLHDSPNLYMTALEWLEQVSVSLDLWGNSYTKIERLGTRIVSLNPLRPDWVTVKFDEKGLRYEYREITGKIETLQPEQVLHIKNFSIDGICGLSPIAMARELIGRGIAMQQYSSAFFRNGARPGGVLEHPKVLSPAATENIRKDWRQLYGGPDNAGSIAVLFEGMKYTPIGLPPEEAQFIETSKMSVADIACIYGVPLNKLNQSDKTATYASAEQFSLDFVADTVRPLAARIEKAVNKALVGPRSDVFAEFDLEGLLRGDAKSRAEFYAVMLDKGVMTRNQVCQKENLPTFDGGEVRTVQSQMVDITSLPDIAAAAAEAAKPKPVAAPVAPAKGNVFAPTIEVQSTLDPEQSAEVIRELDRAARGRKKLITLHRDVDGRILGADVQEAAAQ